MPTTLINSKHYAAAIDFSVEFSNRLASGETLSSGATMTCQTASVGDTSDLTIGSASISGTTITARISAGTAQTQDDDNLWKTRYTIKASVVTSSGETESDVVELVVWDSLQRT